MINLIVLFFIIITFNSSSSQDYQTDCLVKQPLNNVTIDTNGVNTIKNDTEGEFYSCPGLNYPSEYKVCCGHKECCIQKQFLINNQNMAKLIVVLVILSCLLFIITFTICCFWSVCPLYNSCKNRYYNDEMDFVNKATETSTDLVPLDGSSAGNIMYVTKELGSDFSDSKRNTKNNIESIKFVRKDLNEI